MCIKEHTYYVCNCKSVQCPAKYTMCCPYSPSPGFMSIELGHIMSNCKSAETPCATMMLQSLYYPEPCKDAKVELRRENIGLCWDCQATCYNKQTGMATSGDVAALLVLREREQKDWQDQMKKWSDHG